MHIVRLYAGLIAVFALVASAPALARGSAPSSALAWGSDQTPVKAEAISDRRSSEPAQPDFVLEPETFEMVAACGLDLGIFHPVAGPGPQILGDDFDADGSLDFAIRVERRNDRALGVAVCRAGTWLDFFGFTPQAPSCPEAPDLTLRTIWRAVSPEEARMLPRLPAVDADAILYPGTRGRLWHFGYRDGKPICTVIS